DFNVRFFSAFGLALIDRENAATDMLASHFHDVAAPLDRVERERKCKPCSAADWMCGFKGFDVVFGPSCVASRLHFLPGDANRWIFGDLAFALRPAEHRLKRIPEIALGEWCCTLLVDDPLHSLAGQQHDLLAAPVCVIDALIAVRLTKPF